MVVEGWAINTYRHKIDGFYCYEASGRCKKEGNNEVLHQPNISVTTLNYYINLLITKPGQTPGYGIGTFAVIPSNTNIGF